LVNAVAPGLIETDMLAHLPLEQILPAVPLGRPGKPEEVAACAVYLVSDASALFNGANLIIDGGYTIQ